jgi:hypothetical protein
MVAKNFHGFEDWWYHPELVNYENIKHFSLLTEAWFTTNLPLENILPNHQNNIDRDRENFDVQTLNKLK